MPMLLDQAVLSITEKKADDAESFFPSQTKRPVLIVGPESIVAGTPFSNDVYLLTFGQAVGIDPGFERNGVAVVKIKDALVTGIFDSDKGRQPGQHYTHVFFVEIRIPLWPRPGLLQLCFTIRGGKFPNFARQAIVKAPVSDRLI